MTEQKLTADEVQDLFRKTLFNVDTKHQIFFDNIRCCNCGYDGLVVFGATICPKCNRDGYLAWKENQPQEISV
jgi:hypothetical protein